MGNNCCETILDGKTSLTESVLYNKCPLLLVFCSHIHIYFTTGELIFIDYHSNSSMNSVPNIIKISEVAVPTYMYMQERKLIRSDTSSNKRQQFSFENTFST